MAEETADSRSSRTSFIAPLHLAANESKSTVYSLASEEPHPVPNSTSNRPVEDDVPQPQQHHHASPARPSNSPHSPTSASAISATTAETGLPPAQSSAAHAAISQTVDLTNTLTSERLSQGNSGNDGASRPTTGTRSNFTAGSRSHVPSLRTQGFSLPMSSQRLQTQRAARPHSATTHTHNDSQESNEDDEQSRTHRNSTEATQEQAKTKSPAGLHTQYFDDGATAAPTSRGSDTTDRHGWHPHAHATNCGLINGNFHFDAAQSMDSFNYSNQAQKSTILDPEKTYSPDQQHHNPSRSPRSFASAFRRQSGQSNGKVNGHEKLSSQDTTSLRKPSYGKHKGGLGKNWEYFDGNTLFCLGGRLETAKDKPIVLVTASAVVIPTVLWLIFCAPWLWHHVSPAIPIVFAYVFYITMSSFFHACFSDPGILPRNLHPFPPEDVSTDPLALGPPTTSWVRIVSGAEHTGAFEVPVKYCPSCNIWRPPRCHHCRVCDSCIDTQDHHCMWLNNCVGRRNYRYFFSFVGGGSFLAIFMFGSSVGQIAHYREINHIGFGKAIGATAANGVAMFLFLYSIIIFLYPAALWGYHWFLISRGLTTREYLNSNKFLKKDRHRPFNQKSLWRNFVVVLFRPRGPSAMQFKKAYQEGDQRFGDRRGFWRKEHTRSRETTGGQVEMQQLPEARLAPAPSS
ncbi:MAG: hypothetical protein Q9162_003022 [Coniocarpon cinnabarinum]